MIYTNIKSNKIVLTLDAGGTNFRFSAMRGGLFIADEVRLPSHGDNLELSLNQLVRGFESVLSNLDEAPKAISFAFPGPADFPGGVIGDLVNLPGYRGGVPVGPFLEHHFGIPVFINNDGDLFAYGEAMAGFLPWLNNQLAESGSNKEYKNLIGVTLGTGFGGGFVRNGVLLRGDNAAAAEVWSIQHPERPDIFAEEGLSIRGVKRLYKEFIGEDHNLEPVEIAQIAYGQMPGNREAAIEAYNSFGNILGATLANIMTLFDSSVVIGGGIAKSYPLFIKNTLQRLNGSYRSLDGRRINRMEFKVYDYEDEKTFKEFHEGEMHPVLIPGTDKYVNYDPLKRVAIGKTVLGTSRAISLGAYAIALEHLGV